MTASLAGRHVPSSLNGSLTLKEGSKSNGANLSNLLKPPEAGRKKEDESKSALDTLEVHIGDNRTVYSTFSKIPEAPARPASTLRVLPYPP